jgi:hypothetical protein
MLFKIPSSKNLAETTVCKRHSLDLVSESFERVHSLAEKQELRGAAWSILEPFIPELSWGKNWD